MSSPTVPDDLYPASPDTPGRSSWPVAASPPFWSRPQVRRTLVAKAEALRRFLPVVGELSLLGLWTLVFASPYLNLDPTAIPTGREYLAAIQTHHLWTQLQQSGLAALWNGSTRGGAPAFAEPYGSVLHPLVAFTTLVWGVVNGSKLALVASFFLGGLAQWWLARILTVGRVARVWSACMAVVAGHLAARIELGPFGLVLSVAASTLVLPAFISLVLSRRRRDAALLGIVTASAVLAGQGYMQVGLLLSAPAVIVLLPRKRAAIALLTRRCALATGVALLLSAPLLVPLIHFLPEFAKDIDPAFKLAQPFPYVPLNLVIDNHTFYQSDALQKQPYPYLYSNFIGWIPVALAIIGMAATWNSARRNLMFYLAGLAFLSLWISSAEPLKWLVQNVPVKWLSDQLAGFRHSQLISALAIPPILGLAALGLDQTIKARWPRLNVSASANGSAHSLSLDPRWLLLVPLVMAIQTAQTFNSRWIATARQGPEVNIVLESLRTPDLQWINPPFGEQYWVEPAIRKGYKLSFGSRGWDWKNHSNPEPVLEANRATPPKGITPKTVIMGVPIYEAVAGREYAAVVHEGGGRTVCTATGTGGEIDVGCDAPQAGVLTIKENSWSGWNASVDGKAVALRSGQWLAVDLPAGSHRVEFRYQPWDVPVGILLSLVGVGLAGYYYFKREQAEDGA